jgi:hypothetical protein
VIREIYLLAFPEIRQVMLNPKSRIGVELRFGRYSARHSHAPKPVYGVFFVPLGRGLKETCARQKVLSHCIFVQGYAESRLVGYSYESSVDDRFVDPFN